MVTERHIRVGSFLTRYLEAGDPGSEPLLLLHDGAWGGSASVTWGPLIPRLAQSHWVLAPDMLGFGGTDKAIFVDRAPHSFRITHIAQFLRTLGISEPISVVGNSFGGAVALRALAETDSFPIRSVTSSAGTGGPWRPPFAVDELGRWDGTKSDLERVLRHLIDDFAGFDAQLEERYRWATAPGHVKAMNAPTVAVPASLKVKVVDPWPSQIHGVSVPTLLVRGTRDELLQPEWVSHLQRALPQAQVLDMDAKHSPNIDHADAFGDALLDFLAGLPDRSS